MSFASLNKGGTMPAGVDTTGLEYEPLKNFIGKTIRVDGFYFSTKGKYGKSVAILSEGHLINFPNWVVPQFEEIAADKNLIAEMFAGKCGVTNIEKIDTGKGNPTTSFEFTDL